MNGIRFFIKNGLRGQEDRTLTVDVPNHLSPTNQKVINWLKEQQPYLIEGETWEVVATEQIELTETNNGTQT